MSNNWKIYNATTVNEGVITEQDLYIENGRISSIGKPPKVTAKNCEEIDLKGYYLLPGMIDDQVHFREPGLTHKSTIKTESQAAVAGGVTSFMEMPNTQPPTINLSELQNKKNIASQGCSANYSFFLGATLKNIEDIKTLPVGEAAGVKIFMGSSTGNMLVDKEKVLDQIFKHSPSIIATHCEDDQRIKRHEAEFRKKYGDSVSFDMHPLIRDRQACINSTKQAIKLAKKHQTPLHILHISTKEECELFEQNNHNNKLITAEACVHHMYFDDSYYQSLGSLIKCNPAIKTYEDKIAVIRAVNNDNIDIIATDHAPHTLQEKQQSYFKAPSGLPLLQESLPMALELVHDQHLSLTKLVQKTSHAVADRFKIKDRGYIREGYFADLTCVNFHQGYQVDQTNVLSKCSWTPLNKHYFRSSVWATWVSGQLAWFNQQIQPCQGMPVAFQRQR